MQTITPLSHRKPWVDALRAMAILSVLYLHHAKNIYVVAFLNPVKMPLLFALSGYLFKIREGGDKEFFRKLFSGVVVPWLCLGTIPIFLSIPLKGFAHGLSAVQELFSGVRLWFMPCFIIAEVLFHYFLKWSKGHASLLVVFCILATIFGHVMKFNGVLDYAMVNVAFTVQMYFMFGHLYKRYECHFQTKTKSIGAALLIVYILTGIIFFPLSQFDVRAVYYLSIPIGLGMCFIGMTALFMLAPHVRQYPKWVGLVGRNTLVIYMLESYAFLPAELLFDFENNPYWMVCLVTLVSMVWACLVSIAISKILHRYAPWTTGGRY